MITVTDTENYVAYATEIVSADGHADRHGREQAAERLLLAKAFDATARLGHYADGAPYVVGHEGVAVSISHSIGICVLGVAKCGCRLGVDVESPRMQLVRVKSKFLTDVELERLAKVGGLDARMDFLLRSWTAKEAVYKAAGVSGIGLLEMMVSEDFESVSVRGEMYWLNFHPVGKIDLLCVACQLIS